MTGGPIGSVGALTTGAATDLFGAAGTVRVDAASGNPVLTIHSPWGLTDAGVPYYQASGADAADAALLQLDTSGIYHLVKGA